MFEQWICRIQEWISGQDLQLYVKYMLQLIQRRTTILIVLKCKANNNNNKMHFEFYKVINNYFVKLQSWIRFIYLFI